MGRPKKKHVFKDPEIKDVEEIEVEFNCPVRGKVKQKVKVKKIKSIKFEGGQSVMSREELDKLNKEDDEAIISTDATEE